MSEALYRKYRPQVFEDVVGQEHIERTIKNAIERDKVSHAYLFTGPRGTGKTTTARLLAKALLCQCGPTPEPDGTCEDCQLIAAGEHPDVYELDAASRTGVDNVREEIIGRVQFAPTRGRYKIYIIDEVHMLSTAAFNALLKTLEEPPSHVVFILATTDPQKVPETIHSRCQRFDFRRISNDSIVSRLGAICVSEGVEFEGEALELIAHRAEGGMRNALTSLEQLIAFGEGRVTMEVAERMLGSLDSSDLAEIVRFVGTRDVAACFKWTAAFVETGADLAQFTRDFAEHVRNLYVLSLAGTDAALDVTDAARREMVQELPMFGPDRLARLLGVLGDLSAELKTSTNPRLSFEIALTRMVRPESDLTLEGLAARIEALEAKLVQGAFVQGSAGAPISASVGGSTGLPRFAVQGSVDPSGVVSPHSFTDRPSGDSSQVGVAVRSSADMPCVLLPHAGAERSADAGRSGVQSVSAAPSSEAGAFPTSEQGGVVGAQRGLAPECAGTDPETNVALPRTQVPDLGVRQDMTGPAAVAASAVSTGALSAQFGNPAALQRMWQAVLASLKKTKTAYGVLFLNTKAVLDAAGESLVIEFPVENEFAFNAVQKPDIQAELERCIAAACGMAVPFSLRRGSQAVAVASQSVQAAPVSRESAAAAFASAPVGASSETSRLGGQRISAEPAAEAGANSGWGLNRSEGIGAVGVQRGQASEYTGSGFGADAASPRAEALDLGVRQAKPAAYIDDDRPPLDMYDDYVPYDDDGYGSYSSPAPQPAQPQGQSNPQIRPAATAQPAAADIPPWEACTSTPQPQVQLAQSSGAASASSSAGEPSADDLNAVLAFGFGEGLSFTEV